MIATELPLAHLRGMTDEHGLFEHAMGEVPRRELGYCVDDVARGLAVAAREDGRSDAAAALTDCYLRVVEAAVAEHGRAHNRMNAQGEWTDAPGTGDWWGRALWGLGVAARFSSRTSVRERAAAAFHRAARARSPWLRARCFAALGAAEVAAHDGADGAALALLRSAAHAISGHRPGASGWLWLEPRLRYANAVVPEALIAAGRGLGDDRLVERGTDLLRVLMSIETAPDGHLSLTPVGGRGPGDPHPAFDQQPIEAASLAQACVQAFDATRDDGWLTPLQAAWDWFEGANDIGIPLFDPVTGAGYDGLTPTGRNDNRGAESTLAALATLQCLHRATASASVQGASA
ncbi:glycosyltransferase [Microbacterium sp. B35-30]|uniref:glycosyltransferase n=1 Tax=Microbacterium sp. B35-30 TaxID=1962642 RepID=UPI001EF8CDC5|nr:glycosyltransferase [Microbacterium sp. B35-30]